MQYNSNYDPPKAQLRLKVLYIIFNAKYIENEHELVQKAADEIGTTVLKKIPRDGMIQEAEALGKTVVEAFPDCPVSQLYRELALSLVKEE